MHFHSVNCLGLPDTSAVFLGDFRETERCPHRGLALRKRLMRRCLVATRTGAGISVEAGKWGSAFDVLFIVRWTGWRRPEKIGSPTTPASQFSDLQPPLS